MRLATYIHKDLPSFGVVTDEGIADVPALWPGGPRSVLEALQLVDDGLDEIAAVAAVCKTFLPLADVQLLAPIPAPPKVIGLAVNYVEHHQEFVNQRGPGGNTASMPDDPSRTTTPRPFIMPPTCVAAPGAEIPWPVYSKQIDYEVELAVVIGKVCKCVGPENALDCVAGYTIANDVSARSCTYAAARSERPKDAFFDWLHGKWADAFCPLGPWLVTAADIPDPQSLHLQTLVNGEVRQDSSTSLMIHTVAEVVSFLSHLMTLVPGDIIATGTPHGVGMATGKLLKGGDTITCRIEGIGELTNPLGRPPDTFYQPCT